MLVALTSKATECPSTDLVVISTDARGFGNYPGLCAEENVMCDMMTDGRGESICVHLMHLYV